MCVFMRVSYFVFSVRVASFFSYFCVILTLVLSFSTWPLKVTVVCPTVKGKSDYFITVNLRAFPYSSFCFYIYRIYTAKSRPSTPKRQRCLFSAISSSMPLLFMKSVTWFLHDKLINLKSLLESGKFVSDE